jgi:hypothetical protein
MANVDVTESYEYQVRVLDIEAQAFADNDPKGPERFFAQSILNGLGRVHRGGSFPRILSSV